MSDKTHAELGRIETTMLGTEDHGIFTFMITLDFGGTGQGFGGYALDTPTGRGLRFKGRHGTAFGMEAIMQLLDAAGVESWEDLKGKEVWAYRDRDGLGGMIKGIEAPAYRKHKGAFFIEDLAKEYIPEKETKQE